MAPVVMVLWLLVVLGCCSTTLAQALECGDLSPECPEWASRDLCKSDLLFMLRNCPLSCGACEGNCWNLSPECQKWASKDLCRTDPQFMQNVCAVSCKACRVFIEQRSIGNPTFECGKPVTTTDSRRPKRSDGGMMRVTLSHENTTPNIPGIIKPASINTRTQEGDGRITVEDAFCGATPISDRFLLTAAHCVFDHGHVPQTVLLGERDFSTDNETNSKPATYEISRIVVHPNYISDSFVRYNDVALLETKEPIAFNDLVYPYCVSVQRPPTNTTVTGSGFGLVNETHQSPVLQDVELLTIDPAECENIYREADREPHLKVVYPELLQGRDIMCAAYPERSACEGDSGGPLYLDDADGRRFLVGMVGSGVACLGSGASILPGFFVSVADHIQFIDSVIYGGFL